MGAGFSAYSGLRSGEMLERRTGRLYGRRAVSFGSRTAPSALAPKAFLAIGVLLVILAVAPAKASAASVSYYCDDYENTWCGEPGPSFYWQKAEAAPLYLRAYMCVGIQGVGGTGFWTERCSVHKVAAGTAFVRYWGGRYQYDGPFWGYSLMETGLWYVEWQTTWSWFWGP
jgi:hypothetical protein